MRDFNLNAETRDGYPVSAEMKRIWAVELDLMKKLFEVCERHHLRCWVEGGTLLGAIRHKGFIPWDDDTDVSMPRDDYDKLVSIAPKEFQEPYFFQEAYSDEHYFRGHAQLRRSDTAAIRPRESYRPYNQGIFLDVFVLDGCPEDAEKKRALGKKVHNIYKLLKTVDLDVFFSGRWSMIFRKIKARRMVKKLGWTAIFKESEDLLRQNSLEKCKYWGYLSFDKNAVNIDREIYKETIWVDFENIKVPAPIGYEKFLRTVFGDNYMTPIQASNCHGQLVFDTEHSYLELRDKVYKEYRRRWFKKIFK